MFCKNCGTQLPNGSAFCHQCGTKLDETIVTTTSEVAKERGGDGLGIAAKILMIISCICYGISIIGLFALIWAIPMTAVVSNKVKYGKKIGTGLKICTLLFVSTIAGILLLCRKEDETV